MSKRLRQVLSARNLALAVVVLAWTLFLRPQWIGGPATYVLVRGDSMLPTYDNGDFLIAYPQAGYVVGDIVAYKVPAGDIGAGHLVVHRIASAGTDGFALQGDNNPARDPWRATPADLMGRVVLRVPAVGLVLAFVLQPVIAGAFAAALVVMFFVARESALGEPLDRSGRRGSRRLRPGRRNAPA